MALSQAITILPCLFLLSLCATDIYHVEQDADSSSSYWTRDANKGKAKAPDKLQLGGLPGDDPPSCKKNKGCGRSATPSYNYGPLRPTKLAFKKSAVPNWQAPNVEFDIGTPKTTINRVFRESLGYLYARSPSGDKLKCTGTLVNINNIASEPPVIAALVPGHCVFDAGSRCERGDNYEFQTGAHLWKVSGVHHMPAVYTCPQAQSKIKKAHDYALVQLEHSAKACVPDWDKAAFNFHGGPSPCPWAMAIDDANHCAPQKVYAMGRSFTGTLIGVSARANREGSFLRVDNAPVETAGGPIFTKDYVVCGMANLFEEATNGDPVIFSPVLDGLFGGVVSRARTAIKTERARLPRDVQTGGLDPALGQQFLCGGLLDKLSGSTGGDPTGLTSTFKQLLCNNNRLRL